MTKEKLDQGTHIYDKIRSAETFINWLNMRQSTLLPIAFVDDKGQALSPSFILPDSAIVEVKRFYEKNIQAWRKQFEEL